MPAMLLCAFGTIGALEPDASRDDRKVTKLADGVYEIEHKNANDGLASGNTTVLIGERQVLVVDPGFLFDDAREDIAQIRQWTDKPVSFVVDTHWHNDHNLANRAYMDAFPAVTIVAHAETKGDMELAAPGAVSRTERTNAAYQHLADEGKNGNGQPLTDADKAELKTILSRRGAFTDELKRTAFQSATLTFDHDFAIDIGNRIVEIKFLGRGNTAGDAVVYLRKEKIVVAGDLLVKPIPYMYDGYPSDWIATMDRLGQLNAETLVPGHGPVLHDNAYVFLVRDLLQSAATQIHAALLKAGSPAMSRTVEDIRGQVDLSSFRERFVGGDPALAAAFDRAAANLITLVFKEASLR